MWHVFKVKHTTFETMCTSRKYPFPIHGGSIKIPRGWVFKMATFLKASTCMKLDWDFKRCGGRTFKPKN